MVLSTDRERGRITLSTKKLEASRGDMMRDPQSVYENAEERAAEFRERMAAAAQLVQAGALPAATVGEESLAGAV
jgi:small subunit ribosomal protein S1